MISLDVENYCHDCPDFDPICDKLYAGNAPYLTLVSCENKDRCKNLKKYIEQQITRKERDEQRRKETQT